MLYSTNLYQILKGDFQMNKVTKAITVGAFVLGLSGVAGVADASEIPNNMDDYDFTGYELSEADQAAQDELLKIYEQDLANGNAGTYRSPLSLEEYQRLASQ